MLMNNRNSSIIEKNKEHRSILLIAGGSKDNKSAANNQKKVIDILNELSHNIYLITPCNRSFFFKRHYIYNIISYKNQIFSFILTQINQLIATIKILKYNNIDLIIFIFGCDLNILPIIYLKLIKKKIALRSDGRPTKIISKYLGDKYKIKSFLFKLIEEINYRLVDCVLSECNYAISDNEFKKYPKTGSAPLYVDTNKFYFKKENNKRHYDLGYIGRFSEEKGILNLIKAIELIFSKNNKLNIFIAGEGDLFQETYKFIQTEKNQYNITLHPWITPDHLPNYLNDIKLIVLPSKKEGLPNIMLEAMACGTPVLATPVGAIPGVIQDEVTGFIMENNTPECIAQNVIRALNHPDLERIAERGRQYVEKNYSFKETLKRWENILEKI